MDYQVRRSPFKDRFVIPPTPTPDTPACLTPSALRALPYISLIVGIDAITPTKAVYAIYDPHIASLRFVHGDGTFVNAERVCFRNTFKDRTPNLNRSQRLHFIELMSRSVQYYHDIREDECFRAKAAREFPSESSIKAFLTFMCDIQKSPNCPALTDLQPREALGSSEEFQDQAMQCISLIASPTWDFNPNGFQACATQEVEAEVTNLYREYCSRYRATILPIDFQHCLFCLAGLVKVELISFVLAGQNDPKNFILNGAIPPLPLKVLNPRRTSCGWSVDCFIARFERFERIFKGGYERWPNPVAWLEAEMDREECQNQMMRPWKLVVEEGEKEPKEPPVIGWETLQRLKWFTRGNHSQYPKPMFPQKPQPLELHDIISPNSFRSRGSKRAKKDRMEREKAAKETITTADLTGNDTSSGRTNQPATRRAWDKNLDDIHSCYTGDESDLASPMSRKRKYSGDSRPQFTLYVDSDDENLPALEQRQKKRACYQSPPAPKFRMPPTVDMVPAPQLVEDKDYPTRPRSNATPFKAPSSGSAQKSGSWGARRHHIFTTSSPESDSDIEIIPTCDPPRPSTLKPQHISPTKSSASSSSSSSSRDNQSNTIMQERLNAFEHQHKIPNKEFNARYYDRLRSPSASSPESQQNICPNAIPDPKYNHSLHPMSGSSPEQDQLYPTIEFSPSFHTNDHSPSNKRFSQRIIEVVNLESPEPEAGQGGAERSGSSPSGHRFNISIASTGTGFSGTAFKLDGQP